MKLYCLFVDKFEPACQTGFCAETALLGVVNDLFCSVYSGKLVPLCLLDFSTTFDTIKYDVLL